MNSIKSKVMIMANTLVVRGMNRRTAMLKAWVIVKASALRTKVKGTSRRQREREKLAGTNPADISVTLRREPRNTHDRNAIAVYAATADRRAYFVGYLPRAVAAVLAPLMDRGKAPQAAAFCVTGGFNPWVYYGAAVTLRV